MKREKTYWLPFRNGKPVLRGNLDRTPWLKVQRFHAKLISDDVRKVTIVEVIKAPK